VRAAAGLASISAPQLGHDGGRGDLLALKQHAEWHLHDRLQPAQRASMCVKPAASTSAMLRVSIAMPEKGGVSV
jgi:hypothetical protein